MQSSGWQSDSGQSWEWESAVSRVEAPQRCGDVWEKPRESVKGFELIGEKAPQYHWDYVLKDESRRSFAAVLHCPFAEQQCDYFFRKIKSGTDWQQPEGPFGPVPRKTAWMTKQGCSCTYRYGGLEVEAQEFPPFMMEILRATMPFCGLKPHEWPDSCNLNLYENGGMSVGWHADDERLFQGKFQDISIISISLGQTRRFELRPKWPEEGEPTVRRVQLGNGDLMTMEGMTQKHYDHRVPKEHRSEGPRINLTFRWVKWHHPRCHAGQFTRPPPR